MQECNDIFVSAWSEVDEFERWDQYFQEQNKLELDDEMQHVGLISVY